MSSKKYNVTTDSVIGWAKSEVEHVGRIAAVEDPDIQYSYAQSTVNGMLHLRDALFQLVNDPKYADRKDELLMIHDKIVLLVKQLIKQYKVNLDEIKAFNTRKVLGSLNYLKGGSKTRKNRRV
jgi:hypothetical protein